MTTEQIMDLGGSNGKGHMSQRGNLVKVPSKSRPGHVHYVSEDGRNCSCPAAQFGASDCSHRRQVRQGLRPYRVEKRHSSLYGAYEWLVIEQATGYVEGAYFSAGAAYRLMWSLEGYGEAA